MNKSMFHIGDTIKLIGDIGYYVEIGTTGIIIEDEFFCGDENSILVKWDEGYGDKKWYASADKIELAEIKIAKYNFAEAFIAYQEGKIIESCFNNFKFSRNKFNSRDLVLSTSMNGWQENTQGFCREEIQDWWYIND